MKVIVTFALTLGLIFWFTNGSANAAAFKSCNSIESCLSAVDINALRKNLNHSPRLATNTNYGYYPRYRDDDRYQREDRIRSYDRAYAMPIGGRKASHKVFPKQSGDIGEKVFIFSPRYKAWAAYDRHGNRVAHGIANGGANWCADKGRPCRTPVGTFRIGHRGGPGCKSSRYPVGTGGAPMPYCMFFKTNYAIHGSPGISNRNGSHGCVRVTTPAARWLHGRFLTPGTKVKVLPY